jgi:hypothetical protein
MAQEKRRLALDPDATRDASLAVRYAADLLTQNGFLAAFGDVGRALYLYHLSI